MMYPFREISTAIKVFGNGINNLYLENNLTHTGKYSIINVIITFS